MLYQLVKSLSKEEIRHFKLIANGVRKGDNRIDIEFFNALRSASDEKGVDAFRKKHYGSNPNAFYRLKNRLFGRVTRSLLFLHSGEDLHHEILEMVLLARLFNRRECFDICYHFLKKAEKKAQELDNYDYLNIIYRELIRLSYNEIEIDPAVIIEKQKEVLKKQQEINELNNVIAIVMHQLRRTQNLSKGSDEVNEMLADVVNKYSSSTEVSKSFQFRHSLYQAISKFLLQTSDFVSLEEYVGKTYLEFNKDKLFTKSNHDLKLQMITYIVNSSYANEKLEKSLEYTEMLYDEMLKYNRVHYQKYLIFYYHSLVLNFSKSNPKKAIRILTELEENKEFVSNAYYLQFILLNLAILHMDTGSISEAIKSVEKLISSSIFKGLDELLRMQLHLLRLICYYEQEDFDTVLKGHAKLAPKDDLPILGFFQMLEVLASRDAFEIDEGLKERCQGYLNQVSDAGGSRPIYDFKEWFSTQLA